jgi:hypothetical protein
MRRCIYHIYKVTDREALLRSSAILFRTHALELLSCDLTSAFGFGTLRHPITAVAVTARNAHFEEIVAANEVPTALHRAIA